MIVMNIKLLHTSDVTNFLEQTDVKCAFLWEWVWLRETSCLLRVDHLQVMFPDPVTSSAINSSDSFSTTSSLHQNLSFPPQLQFHNVKPINHSAGVCPVDEWL